MGSLSVNAGRNLLMTAVLLLVAGCGGPNPSSVWRVDGDQKRYIQRDLPGSELEDPVAVKFHYNLSQERVYIEARLYPPAQELTEQDALTAKIQFYGFGPLGLSIETYQTREQLSAVAFDPSQSITVSSGVLRETGNTTLDQPYGELQLAATIDETAYEIERRSGLPLIGETSTAQVGDGQVRLELSGPAGETIFTLVDDYVENSSEFSATFTPDGRYLLITLPDAAETAAAQLAGGHRFILVGELPITRDKLDIIAELSLTGKEKEVFEARRQKLQLYEAGLISADDYYGEIYQKAYDKVTQCDDVQHILGVVNSLAVQDSILDFGQPAAVGKIFTFDYTADTSAGTIQVTVLDPVHEPRWSDAYSSYLETIDIRSDTGVRFANCP